MVLDTASAILVLTPLLAPMVKAAGIDPIHSGVVGDTLGVIIGTIRAAGAGHPLAQILDELDELNQYARRHHHGENPNAAMEAVNGGELQGYIRQTLELVACLL